MSNTNFQHHTAIVTGAAQGIGYEMARQLAAQGAAVLLNDIDPILCEKAANEINETYDHCIGLAGDASDPLFIKNMVEMAVGAFGKLTIAIANAGITLFGNFLDYAPDTFHKVIHTNLSSTFFLAQAAAQQMIKQGHGGSLLFTSSVTGHQAYKDLAAYSMTKAAVEMLAKNLVVELSLHGINVNAVAPGATLTERTLEDPDYEKTWSKLTPMGRPAYVKDIAAAALFLVSEQARHITGQTLIVDGGWTSISPA